MAASAVEGSTSAGTTTPTPLTPLAPQTVSSVNFTAATFNDCNSWPPDTMGTVGPTQFIVALNGRIRSFNKQTGAADGAINVDPDVFFSSVMTSGSNASTDPRIRYDRLSQRWFITMIDVPGQQGALPNRIMIAVSSSPTIQAGTVWTFYQFQQDLVGARPNIDTGAFADYPTLGIDANALYIGVNLFDAGGAFKNTTGFVVQKSSVLNGGPIVVTAFRGLVSGNTGPYTPQGVDNFDPAATEGYFIGADDTSSSQLDLRRVTNPGSTSPSISGNIAISVAAWAQPLSITSQGGVDTLDGGDDRLLAAHFRNGSLWTSHNVGVNGTGGRTSPTRDGVQWFQLTGIPSGKTPSVVQSGIVYEPGSAGSLSYWMGTIMVSGQGHAAMGFSAAGPTNYIDAATVGRLATDSSGTMQAPVRFTASNAAYVPADGANPHRWGDYSYTSLDPSDDMTMWTVQEWSDLGGDGYGIQVAKLLAPPPGAPTNCAPASVAQGSTSVSVTIKGSRAGGAGFYDPGVGFSNRLGVVISGAGVTVNSLSYADPGTITAVLTVDANAATGPRTVQVINPDGQSVTSASGLLTISAPANLAPTLAPIPDQSVIAGATLTFTNAASDPDGDLLTFSLASGAPVNASITPATGVFSWTPSEAQAGTNVLSVVVTDSGTPSLSATQSFNVVVLATNSPPVLAAIPSQALYELATLLVTNSATDPNAGQSLTYSLGPGAPTGVNIGATSGILSWTPTAAQVGSNNITVVVADNGTPSLSDSKTFAAIVVPWPTLSVTNFSKAGIRVTWNSLSGTTYQVQYKTNLADAAWSVLVQGITASGSSVSVTDSNANHAVYYRVKVQ